MQLLIRMNPENSIFSEQWTLIIYWDFFIGDHMSCLLSRVLRWEQISRLKGEKEASTSPAKSVEPPQFPRSNP